MKKLIYFALFLAFFLQSVVGQKSVDFINKSKLFYTYGVKDLQMVEKHESATYSQKVKPPQLKTKQSTQSYLVNGLKYNILSEQDKTVELTFLGDSVGDLRYVGNIIVPDRIIIGNNIYTVTVIGDQAFDYCRDLTSIILPNTIISINYAAFYWCDKLTTIDLPSSLKYIGTYAFEYCYGLTSVTIPDQVEKIDDWAFDENINLEIINLPASVSSIGIGAFGFCPKLVAINVAPGNANFTSVDGVLFNKDITTIISYPNSKSATYLIPQTVDSIGDVAFGGCDKLTGIVLPQTLKSIGNSSFNNCSSLTTINLPNSLQSIGEWAFQSCGLSSIYLSESLSFIGKYAFSICPNLGSINWPLSIPVINEGMFWRSSKLLTFDIPATVTKIERAVFVNARSLITITANPNNQFYSSLDGVLFNKNKTILIAFPISKSNIYNVPQTVDSIGYDAFRYCKNLTAITLPASVKSIANVAFDSCVSLKKIIVERSVPPIAYLNTFRGVNKQTCVVKVPTGFVSAYQAAQYWSEFQQITDAVNTAIDRLNNSNLKIYTLHNSIIIEGSELKEIVQIFSTSGKMLHNIQSEGEKIVIPIIHGQIYFVKTNNGGKKVII